MLQIAPSGYRRHVACLRDASRRSLRAQRDEQLVRHIERVWRANLSVYGADKVWRQLHREGMVVARRTIDNGDGFQDKAPGGDLLRVRRGAKSKNPHR